MTRLATKGNRYFMVSEVEVRRIGRSYTVDTVRYFLSTLRTPSTLLLMMGSDQFAELETWKDCDELTGLAASRCIRDCPRAKPGRNGFRLPP